MASRRRVTLRAQWLGRQLRELREENKLKLAEAGECLQRDASTMSRFESGIYPLHEQDLRVLLDFYGVNEPGRRQALLQLSKEAWRTDWWDGYAGDVDRALIDYVWLESRATIIRVFDVMSVYGLLQTSDHVRALLRAERPEASEQRIERWAELRLMRQVVLDRAEPPRLSVVLDEAALWRQIGGGEVHTTQLRHLRDATAKPTIDLRVLPFAAGAHASPDGPFRLMTLTEPFPEVACVEGAGGTVYLEPPKTQRYADMYDRLTEQAYAPDASVALIDSIIRELE